MGNAQKKVSFCPNVSMIQTLHHKNYTRRERKNCWYKKSDFVEWKKDSQPTVNLMKAGESEGEGHCFRGLEHRVVTRARERRKIRMDAWRCIFKKQRELRHHAI